MSRGKAIGAELHDILSPHRHKKGRAVDPKFNTGRPAIKESQSKQSSGTLSGMVKKSPEAMTKITKFSKGGTAAKNHLLYITRNGKVEAENEQGELMTDKRDILDFIKEIQDNINAEKRKENTRTLMHLMVSMPKGTKPEAVRSAAKNFARENFGENHQYVFVLHTDRPHPHVHIAVRTLGKDGRRLNPRKADLAEWRQSFAKWVRMEGVDAIATTRSVRAVTHKAEKSAVQHAQHDEKEGDRSKTTKKRIKDAAADIISDLRPEQPVTPHLQKIKDTQAAVGENIKNQRARVIRVLKNTADQLINPPQLRTASLSELLDSRAIMRKRVEEYVRNTKANGATNVHYPERAHNKRRGDYQHPYPDLLQPRAGELAGRIAPQSINRMRSMPDINVVYKRGVSELLLLKDSYNYVGRVNGSSDIVRRASASNGNVHQGNEGNRRGISDELNRYIDEIAIKPITTRHQELKQELLKKHTLHKEDLYTIAKQKDVVHDTVNKQKVIKKTEKPERKQTKKDAHKQR